jgi:hypothetical protein
MVIAELETAKLKGKEFEWKLEGTQGDRRVRSNARAAQSNTPMLLSMTVRPKTHTLARKC